MMGKCRRYDDCNNRESEVCNTCKDFYNESHFSPIEIKDGECFCMSCKKIITNRRIFPLIEDPKRGLCFDCY